MDIFYPFIHKKKEQNEPLPLYIEQTPPTPEKKKDPESDDDDRGVIIIEIF